MKSHRIAAGVAGLTAALTCAGASFASTGPSSSDAPYVVPSKPGVVTKSILTVGDSVDGYRMVGVPDGLGAYDNGDGTFTLLMNHELRNTQGIPRAHGASGAFVSKWTIDKETLEVKKGEDLIQNLHLTSGTTTLTRLCSADLPDLTAFFNPATGNGYDGRIFTNGEEDAGGRAFAHVATGAEAGESYQLPITGERWENLVANPSTGDKTIVVGTEDTGGGRVVVYEGQKQSTGNAVQKAGLTNGVSNAVAVAGVGVESSPDGIPSGTRFTLAPYAGGTGFLRPEDVAWDVENPNVLYFVTTNDFNKPSRLYRLTFDDVNNPSLGGRIDTLLDGSEGQQMLDNITVTRRGQLILQEDPGNQSYIARVYRYSPDSDKLVEVAHHDTDLFSPTPQGPDFITQDEESSGVIDVSNILGDGKFLFDDQVHTTANDPELVERGQLLALQVPPGQK
ncbi:MAG TPA: hypothetical protein VE570_03940 [Thermoleophilaceae bacterium]|jgi:hypothetical protein|nr:hypothetical protein [Thermoleophilaceae bacterium]